MNILIFKVGNKTIEINKEHYPKMFVLMSGDMEDCQERINTTYQNRIDKGMTEEEAINEVEAQIQNLEMDLEHN